MPEQMKKSNPFNVIKASIIILMLWMCEGCLHHLLFPSTHIEIASSCVVGNELRILLYKEKYVTWSYEGDEININRGFVEYKFDISRLDNNKLDLLENKEILSIEKTGTVGSPRYARDSYDIIVNYHGEPKKERKLYCHSIYSIKDQQLAKLVCSDDPYFGDESYNSSKIYYFQSGEVHLFDINTMTDEVLPPSAYAFMKKTLKKKGHPTDIKYIIAVESNEDEYTLFNVTNNDVVCKFNVKHGDNLFDVASKNDQWVILSGDSSKNAYDVRNRYGEIFNHLDFYDYSIYSYNYFIDAGKDQIYFVRFERVNPGDSGWVKGYLDIIRWNYVTNEVIKVKHKMSW